jgi:mannose-6-phosphate isomerase-like protein (cupin superfamily)
MDCEPATRKCSLLRSKENYLRFASSILETKPIDVAVSQVEWSSDINWLRGGMMNRRGFLASVAALPGAAMFSNSLAQPEQQITHVDTKTSGPSLQSNVVKADGIRPEGAAPGAKAYVQFNGPTEQLAALASGFVMLELGAQPHPPHRHPEEEIMIVGEGTGEFSLDGVAKQVKMGDMLFAEANVLHGVRNTGDTRMTFYFIKMMGKHAS